MPSTHLFPSLAMLLAITACCAVPAQAEMRQWTSADGRSHVEAEFVKLTDDGKVVLRKANGSVLPIPLASLSVLDRNFVRNIGTEEPTKTVKPSEPIKTTKKKLVGGSAIRKVLSRKLKLEYREIPLGEMLGDLKERVGIEIVVDGNSLDEAGVAFDTPITMHLRGYPLGTALQSALHKVGAAWTIRHEVLMIVAKTQKDGLVPVVYKIIRPVNPQKLSSDIRRSVAVPRWHETGGAGRIEQMPRESFSGGSGRIKRQPMILVISQTPEVHAEVAEKYKTVLQPVVLTDTSSTSAVVRGLRQRTNLDLKGAPLSKVLEQLSKKHKLKFTLDHVALAQKDIHAESPVTIQVHGVMVESALGIILDSLKLVAYVDKGTVRVTTKRDNIEEADLISRVYNVRGLRGTIKASKLDDLIENVVARESWEDGKAEINRSRNVEDSLIVRQTPAHHQQINRLLMELMLAQ